MNTATKIIVITLLLAFCMPLFAFAGEIRLDSSKVEVKTGEQFVVSVVVNSGEQLNAIEGQLVFPEDLLSVKEIRDGNSVINFWVEKPHIESVGAVSFSGITPGGWSGVNNFIFSVVFEAKKNGNIPIILQEVTVLRNDGVGTTEHLSIRNVNINIKSGDSKIRKEELIDKEPPEDFTPIISANENLFEGKYSLIFATQDKGSGIDRYEVKEFRFTFLSFFSPWTRVESPHVLKDQSLKSHVIIKAVDNSGNKRIATITPGHSLSWYDYLPIIGIIILVLVFCVFVFKTIWKRK